MSRVLIIIILDVSSVIHLESILGSAESFFVKSGLRRRSWDFKEEGWAEGEGSSFEMQSITEYILQTSQYPPTTTTTSAPGCTGLCSTSSFSSSTTTDTYRWHTLACSLSMTLSLFFWPPPHFTPLSSPWREKMGLWRDKIIVRERRQKKSVIPPYLAVQWRGEPLSSRKVWKRVCTYTHIHYYAPLTHVHTHIYARTRTYTLSSSCTQRRGGMALKREHAAGCCLPGKAWCVPPSGQKHTLPSQRLFVGADSSPVLWLSADSCTGACSRGRGGVRTIDRQSHEKEKQHPGGEEYHSTM